MFGLKTQLKKRLYHSFIGMNSTRFPAKSTSELIIKKYLLDIYRNTDYPTNKTQLGWLQTTLNPLTVWAYRLFIDLNPNHLGNWSNLSDQVRDSRSLERDSIQKMKSLYGCDQKSVDGYITSGATEGNLFFTWIGNSLMKDKFELSKICMIHTTFTHYSLQKSAAITNIPYKNTPLNSSTWGMDPTALKKTIQTQYISGYRGFLIPLTIGYTNTGTSDDIEGVIEIVKEIYNELRDIKCFLWIDAASNGLIEPFIRSFKPFENSSVQGIVTDFHKFGSTPYPSGLVLYRRGLERHIQRNIDYIDNTDTTVLGSRPGSSAAAIWTIIHSKGADGFKNIINIQLENKKYFTHQMHKYFPKIKIVSSPYSLSCGIIFNGLSHKKLNKLFSEKYGFFAKSTSVEFVSGVKKMRIYKVFFLPHVTRRLLNLCIEDLKSAFVPHD